ncbi:lycopene cyclase family protein [Rhodococcus sp. 27YEA15]|uniref:lycopene cyclase family protein n=1 Tax=Rhodococcus sp. 27YEA15 TaxID=3156259 RepID=UPI003C7C46E4
MAGFDTDVVVLGGGPGGRSLAYRCAVRGLSVTVLDPRADRAWTPTYAMWEDELPEWVADGVVASRTERPAVWATRTRTLDRTYVVLNTSKLQSFLSSSSVQFKTLRAESVDNNTVRTADGAEFTGAVIVDARGSSRNTHAARQTAYGVVLDRESAAPALGGQEAWFMDWRADNGTVLGDAPSFLYAVPLDDDRILLEETCLVGRPPLALSELRRRLHARLGARGCDVPADADVEGVRFSVEGSRARRGPIRFGAAAAMMHPGTGYSVAAALSEADGAAAAIVNGRDPNAVLWPPTARAVHALRRVGVTALLTLHHEDAAAFFDVFFALPIEAQRAYLSDRRDVVGAAKAMTAMLRSSSPRVRRTLLRAPLR